MGGEWCNKDGEVEEEIVEFYKKLFTANNTQNFGEVLAGISQSITNQMNEELTKPFDDKEIKNVFWTMNPNKSLGPDDVQQARELKEILRKYEMASGQQINIEKSSVFFSKNLKEQQAQEVCQELGAIKQVDQGKYLGLPMVISKSKNQVFRFVKEKVLQKLQGWKGRLLSLAGKETLIKSVLMAMPNHVMSCFRLSKTLCKEISSIISRFWWGGIEGEKRMCWISWKKGWKKVVIQAGNQTLINKLRKKDTTDGKCGTVLENILYLSSKFHSCSFLVADYRLKKEGAQIASFAVNLSNVIEWEGNFPLWILRMTQ